MNGVSYDRQKNVHRSDYPGIGNCTDQNEYQCRLGIYDDVHYWEEIAKGLLNRCYGFHLANLNEEKKNFPGIDLGDRGRGIGVQVTAEKGSTAGTEGKRNGAHAL